MVAAGKLVVVTDGGAVTVIATAADFVVSATEVAVTVAEPVAALAVKVTAVVVWLDREPDPDRLHVTPLADESLATVAVNAICCN